MKKTKQSGFTLLEVLISVLIFSIGLLGIADSTSRSMHISMDNNARAMLASVASQFTEPLYIDASNVSTGAITKVTFITNLAAIDGQSYSGNNGRDVYDIRLIQAVDNDDNDALTNAASAVSPVRAVIEVSYQGLSGTKTARSSYTFVWKE